MRRCVVFGLLKICDGDVVIVELSRGDVVKGVARIAEQHQRHLVFIALAPDCSSRPMEAISIKRIARIIKIGECRESTRLDNAAATEDNHGQGVRV